MCSILGAYLVIGMLYLKNTISHTAKVEECMENYACF